jgi:hypothetical protein
MSRLASSALLAALVHALLHTGGCASYGLDVAISLPEGYVADDFTFTTSVYAPAAAAAVGGSCDDFLWGQHGVDELASALVGSQPSDAKAGIDIPRTGHKLVVVDAVGRGSQQLALTGCAEVGDIEAEVNIEVALEPVARLSLVADDELIARVPFGAAAEVSPRPTVIAVDHEGEALGGVPVRVTFTAPDGATTVFGEEDTLQTTSTGTLALDMLTVEQMGTFSISATARRVTGELPLPLSGFAVPAQTVVAPFSGEQVLGVVPAPIGPRDVAFVAQASGGAVAGADKLLIAVPSPGAGLPSFVVSEVPSFNARTHRGLGVVRDLDADEGLLVFQNQGLQFGALITVSASGEVIGRLSGATSVPLVDGSPRTLAQLLLTSAAFPTGPCAVHDQAGPQIQLFVTGRDGAPEGEDTDATGLVLYDVLREPPVIKTIPLSGIPAGSFCLDHPDGSRHRVLLMLGADYRRFVVDLGTGVDLDAILAGEETPIALAEPVNLVGSRAVGLLDGPSRELMVATVGGFTVDINRLALSEVEGTLLTEPSFLYTVPGPPRYLGTGAFTGPDRREDFHVLNLSSGTDDNGEPSLLFMAAGDFGSGDLSFGALELKSCPGDKCVALRADFDGDGVHELFVGRTQVGRTVDGEPEVDPVLTEVVRFTQ